ncbi:unnamed protein product [Parascedosporium putredinis]|uniref:Uncharacterized protein n=1 Tax=Parascedosporium putredinis TaxID=1442378 RepID=A0A9P1GV61_9PEZI|nr:unnamed protein product [Parascedosporium putredinis]CAI7987936.1 unnamed protein product [Parascedosporium putredinis]
MPPLSRQQLQEKCLRKPLRYSCVKLRIRSCKTQLPRNCRSKRRRDLKKLSHASGQAWLVLNLGAIGSGYQENKQVK